MLERLIDDDKADKLVLCLFLLSACLGLCKKKRATWEDIPIDLRDGSEHRPSYLVVHKENL